MRAAVFTRPNEVEIQTVAMPVPRPTEVRVRLEGCGISSADVAAWAGMPWRSYPSEPGALGHEGWGVVDAVGSKVETVAIGARVALISSRAYAEYDVTDADKVIPIPRALWLTAFPGSALATALSLFQKAAVKRGEHVAVIGVGFQGAVLTRLACAAGAQVTVFSRRNYALEIARQLGAHGALPLVSPSETFEDAAQLTRSKFFDCVIEINTTHSGHKLAIELAREHGRLVTREDAPPTIEGIRAAIDAIASGRLRPALLYTHHYTLGRLGEALKVAAERPDGFIKAIVKPEGFRPL